LGVITLQSGLKRYLSSEKGEYPSAKYFMKVTCPQYLVHNKRAGYIVNGNIQPVFNPESIIRVMLFLF
jgi:hypothetical protein